MQSLSIPMRDGVRLAIDLLLPRDAPPGQKFPTVISLTRYWRALEFRLPFLTLRQSHPLGRFLVSHGYARVFVDVRGTGASFGTHPYPFSPEERHDDSDLINWIVAQPWSNGRVGGFGDSYAGTAAEFLALTGHPALKAVIVRFNEFDLYTDLAFPGGIRNEWFLQTWNTYNHLLDANKLVPGGGLLARFLARGVKPVDGDKRRRLLQAAVSAHSANGDVDTSTQGIVYRDDRAAGLAVDEISIHTFQSAIEQSGVALSGWGSWFDAGTADVVLKRFINSSQPQQAIIGPWNHGGFAHASPYQPPNAPVDPGIHEQQAMWLHFFDQHLKEAAPGPGAEKRLTYYTLGEERWKTTAVWPPEGCIYQRWYLAANYTLSQTAPPDDTAMDRYTVDFEASTGPHNRWHTQIGGPVRYPDRAAQDQRLLTYTSLPFTDDVEITGYPIVTLYITSTMTDGAFYIYLEDVDEQNRVRHITEGQLRALHRAVASEPPPYRLLVPYHSFLKKDSLPLTPGEEARLTFGLLPTSVLIKKGHRLRIAIAGHDRETFARIPAEGAPIISVARNERSPSFLNLPVIERR